MNSKRPSTVWVVGLTIVHGVVRFHSVPSMDIHMGTDKEQDTDTDMDTNYKYYCKETVLGIKMAVATPLPQRTVLRKMDGQSRDQSHDQSHDQKQDASLRFR